MLAIIGADQLHAEHDVGPIGQSSRKRGDKRKVAFHKEKVASDRSHDTEYPVVDKVGDWRPREKTLIARCMKQKVTAIVGEVPKCEAGEKPLEQVGQTARCREV